MFHNIRRANYVLQNELLLQSPAVDHVVDAGKRFLDVLTASADVQKVRNKSAKSLGRSECLCNLAQTRWTIWVKSPLTGRLLDHPIARNEHGDRVSSGIVVREPRQRAKRSATQMEPNLLLAQLVRQRIHSGRCFIHDAHHNNWRLR